MVPGLPDGKELFARYGERKSAANRYNYFTDPIDTVDREALERKILARYFPEVLKHGVARGQLWLILDSEGRVLATGQEAVTPAPMGGLSSEDIELAVGKHYPGLQAHQFSMRTIFLDSSPQPLKDINGVLALLSCLWLLAGVTLQDLSAQPSHKRNVPLLPQHPRHNRHHRADHQHRRNRKKELEPRPVDYHVTRQPEERQPLHPGPGHPDE